MAHKEIKIYQQTAAGIRRQITLTIPETLELFRKPGNAICQSVIMVA